VVVQIPFILPPHRRTGRRAVVLSIGTDTGLRTFILSGAAALSSGVPSRPGKGRNLTEGRGCRITVGPSNGRELRVNLALGLAGELSLRAILHQALFGLVISQAIPLHVQRKGRKGDHSGCGSAVTVRHAQGLRKPAPGELERCRLTGRDQQTSRHHGLIMVPANVTDYR